MKVDTSLAPAAPADVPAEAAGAEHAGYAAIWTAETTHDPLLTLALAATATETIELGTGIAVAFARNPMSLAVQANDLQLLSKGRLLLGLGSQIKPHITRRFSMPWSHPAPRMREYILALRAIWNCWHTGAALNFRGEFYTHTLMSPFFNPGPNPYGPPKVLLAGVGPAMTAVAGEVADGFLVHGFTTERYLREVTLPALTEAGAGDAFEVAGSPFVATGCTEAELAAAKDAVRAQIAFYGSTPAYRPVLELHGWGGLQDELNRLTRLDQWQQMGALITDEVLDAFAVVADPDQVAGLLRHRFGDVFTRMTLYTPYPLDAKLAGQIAGALRAEGRDTEGKARHTDQLRPKEAAERA